MKIERKDRSFTPIVITIETQAELDALWIGMNHSHPTFESAVPMKFSSTHEVFLEARNTYAYVWALLDSVR